MRRFIILVVLLLLAAFQNSILELVRIFGIKPDLILIFIICLSLIRGNPYGTIIGIAGGIIEDVFFRGAFGINSIGCLIVTYLIGSIEGKIYKDNIFVPGLFVFGGTVVKNTIVFLFLYLTRSTFNIQEAFMGIIIPEALYNSILAAIFFKGIVKFSNKYYFEQTWRF